MSKPKPTLDIYYEICIRQIAYLYYSWSSLNTMEDIFYNGHTIIDTFGQFIDGVDIDSNLIDLGLQMILRADKDALATLGISLNPHRRNMVVKPFGSVQPKQRFADIKFNRLKLPKSDGIDEARVTITTAHLCCLCLSVPANYIYRNTLEETLIIKTRSYKELAFVNNLCRTIDTYEDSTPADIVERTTIGTKRKQPVGPRVNIKPYEDLKARRQFDIIKIVSGLIEVIPQFARYSFKSSKN